MPNAPTGYHLPSSWGNALPNIPKPLQAAYKAFYATLTPDQLKAIGGKPHPSNLSGEITPTLKECLHIPTTEGESCQGRTVYDLLSADQDPAELTDSPTPSNLIPAILVLEIVRKVLHAWTSAPDRSTRLHGEVLGVALGIPGETVTSLSRKYGCTRQAISKRHRSIVKALSLPPNVRMVLARTKAAEVLRRKNIALPTRNKRLKGHTPPINPQ